MRLGILGSGLMGAKLGTILARAGHEVVFSYARSNDKLKRLARDAQGKSRAGTPGEAAKEADAILLAVNWSRIDDVLKQAGDLSGKVILTCCLPMDAGNTKLIIGTTTVGSGRTCKESSTRSRRRSLPNHNPAKCCSECSKPNARSPARAWCTAATTRAARM
jgi:predicted dinucleotide-binding enzyme